MGAWAPRGRPRKRAGCWSVMMSIKSWVAWPGAPIALASAALFGASTPLAKALLGGGISPWLLAGLIFWGSGIGLALITVLLRPVRQALGDGRVGRGAWPVVVDLP